MMNPPATSNAAPCTAMYLGVVVVIASPPAIIYAGEIPRSEACKHREASAPRYLVPYGGRDRRSDGVGGGLGDRSWEIGARVYMVFRAEDTIGKHAGTSRLGLAISDDGLHFVKQPSPIFYPDNDSMKIYKWEGGVEDPRIIESNDGLYVMTYTAYDGALARLCLATSTDLLSWIKHGLVLKGKYTDTWSKSGAIVAKQTGDKVVAEKINGKYWMYFGDTDLFIATSDDLITWTPIEDDGKLKSVLQPRPGYFDSRLVESGPYALIRDEGILLLYNGMNLDSGGDPDVSPGAYCAGQALFDKNDPVTVIDRLEHHFISPNMPYEIAGQVNQVCFIEGMVPFDGKWFLYYGTADSKIAVAVGQQHR